MSGARIPVTFPIRWIPPRITSATTDAVTSPVIQTGIPYSVSMASATVLAWIPFPVRNAVRPSMVAKKTAIHFQFGPSPFSM